MNKYIRIILSPRKLATRVMASKPFHLIPDRFFLQLKYFIFTGSILHLKNPVLFNEKMQWLKLYARKPHYSLLANKLGLRDYIKEIGESDRLVPLLGVYESYEQIDFDLLPDQFVLKPSHSSGDVYICINKEEIDHQYLKKRINRWRKKNYYWYHREWVYKYMRPLIICEKYLSDENNQVIMDYKILCFNGKPTFIQVHSGRFLNHRKNIYDLGWNYIPATYNIPNDAALEIKKPDNLAKMLLLAKKLSHGIPFVRVDFYTIGKTYYLGEMTFFPVAGFARFMPETFNRLMGDLIQLPDTKANSLERKKSNAVVSVIIPTYKRSTKILDRAVKSVLNQTYPNIELIIVDDNSNIESYRPEILLYVNSLNNNRIRLIQNESNQGGAESRNIGIRNSHGDYVAFLDDDDEWLPEKIELQMEKFDDPEVGLVYCDSNTIIIKNEKRIKTKKRKRRIRGWAFEQLLISNIVGSTSFAIIRRSALNACGLFDPQLKALQDYDLWLRIAQRFKVDYVDKSLVNYFLHDQERISGSMANKVQGKNAVIQKYTDYLEQNKKLYAKKKMSLLIYSHDLLTSKSLLNAWKDAFCVYPYDISHIKVLFILILKRLRRKGTSK